MNYTKSLFLISSYLALLFVISGTLDNFLLSNLTVSTIRAKYTITAHADPITIPATISSK